MDSICPSVSLIFASTSSSLAKYSFIKSFAASFTSPSLVPSRPPSPGICDHSNSASKRSSSCSLAKSSAAVPAFTASSICDLSASAFFALSAFLFSATALYLSSFAPPLRTSATSARPSLVSSSKRFTLLSYTSSNFSAASRFSLAACSAFVVSSSLEVPDFAASSIPASLFS